MLRFGVVWAPRADEEATGRGWVWIEGLRIRLLVEEVVVVVVFAGWRLGGRRGRLGVIGRL